MWGGDAGKKMIIELEGDNKDATWILGRPNSGKATVQFKPLDEGRKKLGA